MKWSASSTENRELVLIVMRIGRCQEDVGRWQIGEIVGD